jgi:hypothetical protein
MVAITQYPGLEIAAVFAREWDASMAGAQHKNSRGFRRGLAPFAGDHDS